MIVKSLIAKLQQSVAQAFQDDYFFFPVFNINPPFFSTKEKTLIARYFLLSNLQRSMLGHNVKMPKPTAEPSNKKVCRSKNLELIKAKLGNALNAYERRELIKFLEQIGSCDIIEKLPISILTLVCQHFTPYELCQLRLGKPSAWHVMVCVLY